MSVPNPVITLMTKPRIAITPPMSATATVVFCKVAEQPRRAAQRGDVLKAHGREHRAAVDDRADAEEDDDEAQRVGRGRG